MSDELVTVATFPDSFAANIAKISLTEAGMQAFLADEEAMAMVWYLGGAIGGVKLQVAQKDAEHALAELSDETPSDAAELEQAWQVSSAEVEPGTAPQSEQSADEAYELTAREQTALRVVRGAIIGIKFPPFELFVLWMLLDVFRSSERLRFKYRLYTILAAIIAVPVGILAGLLICLIILAIIGLALQLLFGRL